MLYLPELFAERDVAALHDFIDENAFATLISPDPSDPPITHLPLLLDRQRGEQGVLLGHVARSNSHWQRLRTQPGVLALFHGPHAYISPAWYASHPSVPTWNYAAVHVHGTAHVLHERSALSGLVRALVERYESPRLHRWHMNLPAEFEERMLDAIVGFEILITSMTGKFKLSQNRPEADRSRVETELHAGSAAEQAVAELMRRRRS